MKSDSKLKNYFFVLLALAVIFIVAALFSGCMTPQRAERKLEKLLQKQPMEVAEFTRDKFPCIVTHQSHDTTFVQGDSVISLIQMPCPDVLQPKNIHDTIHHVQYVKVPIKISSEKEIIHDKIFVEDSAKIFIANAENVKIQQQLDEAISSRNMWRKWCLIFGGILLLQIVFILLKFGAKITIPIPFH
jgi:hypothetical protein